MIGSPSSPCSQPWRLGVWAENSRLLIKDSFSGDLPHPTSLWGHQESPHWNKDALSILITGNPRVLGALCLQVGTSTQYLCDTTGASEARRPCVGQCGCFLGGGLTAEGRQAGDRQSHQRFVPDRHLLAGLGAMAAPCGVSLFFVDDVSPIDVVWMLRQRFSPVDGCPSMLSLQCWPWSAVVQGRCSPKQQGRRGSSCRALYSASFPGVWVLPFGSVFAGCLLPLGIRRAGPHSVPHPVTGWPVGRTHGSGERQTMNWSSKIRASSYCSKLCFASKTSVFYFS